MYVLKCSFWEFAKLGKNAKNDQKVQKQPKTAFLALFAFFVFFHFFLGCRQHRSGHPEAQTQPIFNIAKKLV